MFDPHCHLDDERLAADLPQVLARAREAGITGFIVAGVDPEGWRRQDGLARREPDVSVTYALHPRAVPGLSDDEALAAVGSLADALAHGSLFPPVGLGEIGLDTMGAEQRACVPLQEHVFRQQLALARERDLPVVLHILRAHGRALEILRTDGVPRAGGMVHCYSGAADLVSQYVALGLHISFAGPVTYETAGKVREAARVVPVDRLLAETDAPDLTPEPIRPGRNEPAYLLHVIRALAETRGERPDEIARLTEQNARRLFGLRPPLERP